MGLEDCHVCTKRARQLERRIEGPDRGERKRSIRILEIGQIITRKSKDNHLEKGGMKELVEKQGAAKGRDQMKQKRPQNGSIGETGGIVCQILRYSHKDSPSNASPSPSHPPSPPSHSLRHGNKQGAEKGIRWLDVSIQTKRDSWREQMPRCMHPGKGWRQDKWSCQRNIHV